jgi:hypothetical protein
MAMRIGKAIAGLAAAMGLLALAAPAAARDLPEGGMTAT